PSRAGAQGVVRLNPYHMPLFQPDETPLDLVECLQEQAPCTVRSLPGRVGPPTQRVAGGGHAYRLSEEHAHQARAVCRQRNSKKGHTPQARTLFLAAWVLVWTSLPPEVLRADTGLALYRVRWPVEIDQSCNLRRTLFWLKLDSLSLHTAQRAICGGE